MSDFTVSRGAKNAMKPVRRTLLRLVGVGVIIVGLGAGLRLVRRVCNSRRLSPPHPSIRSVERTADGLLATSEGRVLQLSAVTDRVFRLRVAPARDSLPRPVGTFVAGDHPAARWVVDGAAIRTAGGSLGLSRTTGELILAGSNGQTRCGPLIAAATDIGWQLSSPSGAGERVYGFGNESRHARGSLVKNSGESRVRNGVSQPPFVWSTAGYGMLVDREEPGVLWRREGGRQIWTVPGPVLDVFLMLGDTPYGILDAYTELTGRPLVPPRWTFGFMQSRWSYTSSQDVQETWRRFRQHRIPIDACIYDYDWFVNDWEWNRRTFPDPRRALLAARKLGIRIVLIRKPRVYGANRALVERNGWVGAWGRRGDAPDLDFAKPEVRRWWWARHVPLVEDGVAGWWNDEAEHYYTEFFYMALAQYEGLERSRPNQRNWSLNRAFSPGMQRLGTAVWTGDVLSEWAALPETCETLLQYGLTGMPYCGSDIGGFDGQPSGELFTRWMQAAVFHPVMRAHGTAYQDRWPWAFGPAVERAVTKAIQLRYRLVPVIYSSAHEAYNTGAPLIRPLFFEFPDDPQSWNMTDQWLLGDSLLVAPQMTEGGFRRVYVPEGRWFEFGTGRVRRGPEFLRVRSALDEIPVYVRAGSIVPLGPVLQYTGEKPVDPLTVEVYPGRDARFTLVEDDGETYDYRRGRVARTPMDWSDRARTLTVGPVQGERNLAPQRRTVLARIYGLREPRNVTINGRLLPRTRIETRLRWRYLPAAGAIEVTSKGVTSGQRLQITIGRSL